MPFRRASGVRVEWKLATGSRKRRKRLRRTQRQNPLPSLLPTAWIAFPTSATPPPPESKQPPPGPSSLGRKMEPGQSGTEQASPRGNDWEVVQLTASAYAAAPAPRRPEPSDEAEAKRYGAKGDDLAAGLLMSGHFSVSQSEVESLLVGADTKEPCGPDAVSDERGGDGEKYQESCKHKLLEDDVPSIPSLGRKGKDVSLGGMAFDDGKALEGMGLVGEEPVGFSSPVYSSMEAGNELGWSATESRSEKRTEEPAAALRSLSPVTGSSKAVSPDEQGEPAAGSGPREAWWKKQLLSLYKNAKESKHFWPIVATTAALVGLAYLGRRWHNGRLQFQLLKISPSSNKEKISDAVGPLNRINDILVAGNHPSHGIHGHARAR